MVILDKVNTDLQTDDEYKELEHPKFFNSVIRDFQIIMIFHEKNQLAGSALS